MVSVESECLALLYTMIVFSVIYLDRNGLNVLLFSMICSEVAESRAIAEH